MPTLSVIIPVYNERNTKLEILNRVHRVQMDKQVIIVDDSSTDGTRLSDVTTCYKMFRTDLVKSLALDCRGFEFETEVTARLARRGVNICEVPISYQPRSPREGKKIGWRDGFKALAALLRHRFRVAEPQPKPASQR